MAFIDRMERKFGWLSFPGFLRYYALLYAMVYALQIFRPDIDFVLRFDRNRVLAGEVWRVVTCLFVANGFSWIGLFFLIFLVNISFMISDALEGAWGVFRTSLFYYCGVLGLIAANFLYSRGLPESGLFLYTSSFLAFATLFPKVELLLLVIPVQVRFLGFLAAAGLLLMVIGNIWLFPYVLLCFFNYLLFVGIPTLRGQVKTMESVQRRKKFKAAKLPESAAFHTCATCGRTDVSDPELEFRISSDGREFCDDHLPTEPK